MKESEEESRELLRSILLLKQGASPSIEFMRLVLERVLEHLDEGDKVIWTKSFLKIKRLKYFFIFMKILNILQ